MLRYARARRKEGTHVRAYDTRCNTDGAGVAFVEKTKNRFKWILKGNHFTLVIVIRNNRYHG